MRFLAGLFLAATLAACAVAPAPDSAHVDELLYSAVQGAETQRKTLSVNLLDRILTKIDSAGGGAPASMDVLMLSGGGEYGAFGVGVLQGWTQAGPLPQPDFDVVTGVSTGALIAPFALLGTEDSIGRIDHLYRETDRSYAVLRDMLYFLPWRESFYKNDALRARVHSEINESMAKKIEAEYMQHRLLLIGTTDLHLGRMRIWDFGLESQHALADGDYKRLADILIASAAIPAVFPPVTIDGSVHSDGGVTQQAFLGFDLEQIVEILQEAKRLRPNAALPSFRFWIIVNGPLDDAREVITPGWSSVAKRSLRVLMRYSMRVTLRHLEFGSALLASSTGTNVEFRYVSVPNDFRRRVASDVLFDSEFMLQLNELGRRLGADPSSWKTTVGPVERFNAEPVPVK